MPKDFKWTHDAIVKVATEMYVDGTGRCERYSIETIKLRDWPPIEDENIISALDAYIKYLKSMDLYNGKEQPVYRTEFSVGIRKDVEEYKKT